MSIYLKSAVQNLDCVITELTEVRAKLVAYLGAPVIGTEVFQPVPGETVPVQVLELKGNTKHRTSNIQRSTSKLKKQNGGGRRVETEVRSPKPEGGASALTPLSEGMLAAGRSALEPLTTEILTIGTGCTSKQAANAITRWLTNGFIKRTGRGEYRRLAKFPGAQKATVEQTPGTNRFRVVGRAERPAAAKAEPEAPLKEFAEKGYPSVANDPLVQKPLEVFRKETKSAPVPAAAENGAPVLADGKQQRPTVEGEEKLTPYSAKGIAVGKSLKAVFNMEELAALLPQGRPAAYYFVAQWTSRKWIRKEDYDIYRKETTFGT